MKYDPSNYTYDNALIKFMDVYFSGVSNYQLASPYTIRSEDNDYIIEVKDEEYPRAFKFQYLNDKVCLVACLHWIKRSEDKVELILEDKFKISYKMARYIYREFNLNKKTKHNSYEKIRDYICKHKRYV